MKIKYLHLRRIHDDIILSRGGLTIAFRVEGDKMLVACAFCSDRDNYNRRLGRMIAGGRLEKGKNLEAIIFDPTPGAEDGSPKISEAEQVLGALHPEQSGYHLVRRERKSFPLPH